MVMPVTAVSPPFLTAGEAIGVVARRATARALEIGDCTLISLSQMSGVPISFVEKSSGYHSNWRHQSVADLPISDPYTV
jgi:hypothetical protein